MGVVRPMAPLEIKIMLGWGGPRARSLLARLLEAAWNGLWGDQTNSKIAKAGSCTNRVLGSGGIGSKGGIHRTVRSTNAEGFH